MSRTNDHVSSRTHLASERNLAITPGSSNLEDLHLLFFKFDSQWFRREDRRQLTNSFLARHLINGGNVMDQSLCQEHDTLAQLSAAERLFVWGVRSVAQYQRLGWPTVAEIRRVYDMFRVGDAVPSLEVLLEAFACTAHTAIELHCPVCRRLSPSEHQLLQAVSAVQCERFDIACEQFEHWLPPMASEWALAPARGLATYSKSLV
jgi:hypothetical protein